MTCLPEGKNSGIMIFYSIYIVSIKSFNNLRFLFLENLLKKCMNIVMHPEKICMPELYTSIRCFNKVPLVFSANS